LDWVEPIFEEFGKQMGWVEPIFEEFAKQMDWVHREYSLNPIGPPKTKESVGPT